MNFHKREKWRKQKETLIAKHTKVLEGKDIELNKFAVRVEEVADKAVQIIRCKLPIRTYALFLQEFFLSFQFSRLISNQSIAMSRKFDFLNIFVESTPDEQDQLWQYYLHKYVVPKETEWNTLMFLGDLQVRALASYFRNEIFKGELMEEYEERDKCVALPVRKESKNPDSIINEWLQLLEYKGLGSKDHETEDAGL